MDSQSAETFAEKAQASENTQPSVEACMETVGGDVESSMFLGGDSLKSRDSSLCQKIFTVTAAAVSVETMENIKKDADIIKGCKQTSSATSASQSLEFPATTRTTNIPVDTQMTQASKNASNESGATNNDEDSTELFLKEVNVYVEDKGPKWYDAYGTNITAPFSPKKLTEAFANLPIKGGPKAGESLEQFGTRKIREFVGLGLNDEQFSKLAKYCSPDHLKTGNELKMLTKAPNLGLLPNDIDILNLKKRNQLPVSGDGPELCVVKRYKMRVEKDENNYYSKRLKYRGINVMPLQHQPVTPSNAEVLEPGKDLLFRARLYRGYSCNQSDKPTRTRHSVMSCDVVLTSRNTLADLRDRIVCANDLDMRLDVSSRPKDMPSTTAFELFPSGFMFINNVFYVDERAGCADLTRVLRDFARKRHIGHFDKRSMIVTLGELVTRLGHPEVYVHQGNCEHIFTFSEVRLMSASDPLLLSHYPCHTAIAQNQTVYCTTCAEYSANYIVVGSNRIPFDPAFFCSQCLEQYMYIDGKKIGSFKLYRYSGNEINVLKPIT